MKNKKVVIIVLAAVLALTGCASIVATKTVAPEAQTVETTEEGTVPETETVTLETNNIKAELEVKTLTEITNEPSPKAETIGYTYTDMSAIMYAKSAVNVRSLPSTDGTRLGTLVANQPVAVTGQCNETGWYRIQYGDGEAYVSNKYLVGEEQSVAQSTVEQSPQTEETPVYSGDTQMIMLTAAMEQFGMNILVYGDGTIVDATTWKQIGTVDTNGQVTVSPDAESARATTAQKTDGFNRAAAEEVWAYMNAERVAAGLSEITWDEEIYNFACQRAQATVTDYSHNGNKREYGENIAQDYSGDGYRIHMQWYGSPGHHANYMTPKYTIGACAVYVYNGVSYCVENFSYGRSSSKGVTDTVVSTWTASNGVTISVLKSGNLSANAVGPEADAAFAEYEASH